MHNDLEVGEASIRFRGDIVICRRNAGECYGGIREIRVNCEGVHKRKLKAFIKEHAGEIYAKLI